MYYVIGLLKKTWNKEHEANPLCYSLSHQYEIWRLWGAQEVNHDWDEWEKELWTIIISDDYVILGILFTSIPVISEKDLYMSFWIRPNIAEEETEVKRCEGVYM